MNIGELLEKATGFTNLILKINYKHVETVDMTDEYALNEIATKYEKNEIMFYEPVLEDDMTDINLVVCLEKLSKKNR